MIDLVNVDGKDYFRPCGLTCTGVHAVGGHRIQLNPSVVFDECFSHPAGIDVNTVYMFSLVSGIRLIFYS